MNREDDSDLRPLFERLKAEDSRRGRPFPWYLERAERSEMRFWYRGPFHRSRVAIGLALVLITGVVVRIRDSGQAPIGQISRWRSPTASLLHTPGDPLFTSMPRIESPLIPSFQEQRH